MGKYQLNFYERGVPDEQFLQDVVETFKDPEEYHTYVSFLKYFCKDTYEKDDPHAILLYLLQAINHQRIINEDLQNQIDHLKIQLLLKNKDKNI